MNGYKIVLLKAIFMLYRLPESERVCSGICSQKVVFYGVSVLALLLMVIPLGFLDDKKIRKEVRQELREHPRYWKRAMVIYIAAIVALVVAVNIAFPYL